MKNKLTNKEQLEATLVTVGRLRAAIKYADKERQLLLLEKVARDIEEMEEYEWHLESELKYNFVRKYDIFNLMKTGGELNGRNI